MWRLRRGRKKGSTIALRSSSRCFSLLLVHSHLNHSQQMVVRIGHEDISVVGNSDSTRGVEARLIRVPVGVAEPRFGGCQTLGVGGRSVAAPSSKARNFHIAPNLVPRTVKSDIAGDFADAVIACVSYKEDKSPIMILPYGGVRIERVSVLPPLPVVPDGNSRGRGEFSNCAISVLVAVFACGLGVSGSDL